MSIRRAADAGWNPWLGFLVLVPVVNWPFMLSMCFVPSDPQGVWIGRPVESPARGDGLHAAMSVGAALGLGGMVFVASVYVLSLYGSSLFYGTPLMMGAIASYLYNRPAPRSFQASMSVGAATAIFGSAALLLFALEGLVCLLMALPLAAMGGALGKATADASRRPARELAAVLLVLPAWTLIESWLARAPVRVVLTSVEVSAPPEEVWQRVIAFPDLPRERSWYFRLGIACPERARMEGRGIGATRYCEFSTGTFVEPITAWDEPHRLAFDVTQQPHPMVELSPYGAIQAPHLDGFFESVRGEFRLIELPGGRTRLEGRTWYRCHMFPQPYWTGWSDLIIQKIHQRVLEHIQRLCQDPDTRSQPGG